LKATVTWEALGADADGDGLTDLAEGRLGTDPGRADTDGDVEPDGSDRNPLAGPGPGDDAAQVRCAALRFWVDLAGLPSDRTVVVQVEGAPPSLDAGSGRVIVVDADGWKGWCEKVGRPACGLRFGVSDGSPGREPLLIEGDRATVILTSDAGPARTLSVAFRLRKVGDLWAVTDWLRIR